MERKCLRQVCHQRPPMIISQRKVIKQVEDTASQAIHSRFSISSSEQTTLSLLHSTVTILLGLTIYVEKGNQISAIELVQKETETISMEPRDLQVTVECTLEEYFYGCQKEISFKRHILNANNADTVVTVKRVIEVKPGMGHNELRYSGEGHQRFGQ